MEEKESLCSIFSALNNKPVLDTAHRTAEASPVLNKVSLGCQSNKMNCMNYLGGVGKG
jgi:hypothetical protein